MAEKKIQIKKIVHNPAIGGVFSLHKTCIGGDGTWDVIAEEVEVDEEGVLQTPVIVTYDTDDCPYGISIQAISTCGVKYTESVEYNEPTTTTTTTSSTTTTTTIPSSTTTTTTIIESFECGDGLNTKIVQEGTTKIETYDMGATAGIAKMNYEVTSVKAGSSMTIQILYKNNIIAAQSGLVTGSNGSIDFNYNPIGTDYTVTVKYIVSE